MGCVHSQAEAPEKQLRAARRSRTQIAPVGHLPSNTSQTRSWVHDQSELGAQSFRGDPEGKHAARITQVYVMGDAHAEACFAELAQRECDFCGEWVVLYHSYQYAALLYEVQAAMANILFGFPSHSSPLPRLLGSDFLKDPDAKSLMARLPRFERENPGKADHHADFRRVAISSMCSLMSSGPEVCIARTFVRGYSCKQIPYANLLASVLQACSASSSQVASLVKAIVELAEEHGLDASMFGGKPLESGRSGHLMQVFIRRDVADTLAYAARPYGGVDSQRMPLAQWLGGDHSFSKGQARIVANPANFLRTDQVRIFVASADPSFHERRNVFQQDLIQVLSAAIEPGRRASIAGKVCSSVPPKMYGHEQDQDSNGFCGEQHECQTNSDEGAP